MIHRRSNLKQPARYSGSASQPLRKLTQPLTITPSNLIFKRATLKGFWAARPSEILSREQIGALIGEIVKRAAMGEIKLPVAEVFDLADAARACTASDIPGRNGKIALRG